MKPLLLALFLIRLAWAQPGNVTRPTPSIFDYRQELALTPEQIKEIKQAVRELMDSSQKQTRRIQQLDQEYRQMLRQDTPLEQAHTKLIEIEKARTDWRYNDLKASYRILGILSPEQKTKLLTTIA
ncbi:hypothetical protein IV102_08720 [bacterium]|nr:hypothetical protein [bacterium]